MTSFQYSPINDSCLTYDNTQHIYSTLNLDDSQKKDYKKSLSLLSKGNYYDTDNKTYEYNNNCIIPNEVYSFFNANYSEFKKIDNPNITPYGFYTNTMDSEKFSKSIGEFINIMNKTNNDELTTLSNKIISLSNRNIDYSNNTLIPNMKLQTDTSNKYMNLYSVCTNNITNFNDTSNYINTTAVTNIKNKINDFNINMVTYNSVKNNYIDSSSKCIKNTPFILRSGLDNSKCLDVLGYCNINTIRGDQGLKIGAFTCTKSNNQQWIHDDKNRLSTKAYPGYYLDLAYAATSNSARLHMWPHHPDSYNRLWTYNSNTSTIYPPWAPNVCIDIPEAKNRTNAYIWSCHGGPQQKWIREPVKSYSTDLPDLKQNYDPNYPAFFQGINFQGNFISLVKGSYTLALLREIYNNFNWQMPYDINDSIKSIYIPNGYTITAYQHDIFQGSSIKLTSSSTDLGSFKNQISSIVIT